MPPENSDSDLTKQKQNLVQAVSTIKLAGLLVRGYLAIHKLKSLGKFKTKLTNKAIKILEYHYCIKGPKLVTYVKELEELVQDMEHDLKILNEIN